MNEMNEIYQTWKETSVGASALCGLCTGQQFHVTTRDIELNFSVSLSFQVSPSRLDLTISHISSSINFVQPHSSLKYALDIM